MRRRGRLRLLAVLLATLLGACSTKFEAPPIELSSRESLIGAGVILQIRNTASEPLAGLEVEITAPDGTTRHFVQDTVDGHSTVEVGWKKLGGWKIPAESKVEIRADGYLRAVTATLAG